MMKELGIKLGLVMMIAALTLCLTAPPASALFGGGKVEHFTADNVVIDPSGKVLNTSKIYVSKDVMRIDGLGGMMAMGMGGKAAPDISVLVFKNQGKLYYYNHGKKLVFEDTMGKEDLLPGYEAMGNVESEKVVGQEKVSGYKCTKKEIVIDSNMMGMNQKNTLTVWESDRFESPLRTITDDGAINELRNIKEGKPPAKYLRLLPGYKKVGNMMAVLGLDFGAMMDQDKDDSAQKKTGGQASNQQDMQNMNVKDVMAQMSQAMGDQMDPEEKKQLMAIMANAMNQAKNTKEGAGAAKQIWQFIPQRQGDKIGSELKTTNVLTVTMGTKADLMSVFTFYKTKLASKGWRDQGMFLQSGQGHLSMSKGDMTLSVSSADNPGIQGSYANFYMMQLTGPNL